MTVRGTLRMAAALIVVLTLGGCATPVSGKAVRASGEPQPHMIAARDLLLQDGDTTPLGPATAAPVGTNFFTSTRPEECSAAMLFEGSPLRPAGSREHAESSYKFDSQALYAESIDVYDNALNTHDVVWNGFSAVSNCRGDAIGVSPSGDFGPMRLSFFGTTSDGVLVWTMTRPDWTCDYGLAVIPRVVLVMSVCDSKAGFPMPDWAAKRRAQLESKA
ncbi:hypothetical protein A9W99_14040 [Mycobacterium sp. 1164966.3]|uniref:hypothetical protein n=1 Tax=Mycobacterium sp. 1164966.3 TaxID=1856861 RepID=UPI0007FE4DEC|nr:hypothetical protein [Mycobacterium sp. 1164966.3]OBA81312.1 hypothetical protein A9W99_14040 [Mycobacterium sp. 1164966.3]